MEVINQKKANKLNIIKTSYLTNQEKEEYYSAFLFTIFAFNNWFFSEEINKNYLQKNIMGTVSSFNNQLEVIFSCNLIDQKWQIYTFYNDKGIIKVNYHILNDLKHLVFYPNLNGFDLLFKD